LGKRDRARVIGAVRVLQAPLPEPWATALHWNTGIGLGLQQTRYDVSALWRLTEDASHLSLKKLTLAMPERHVLVVG
jgi:hypothetical protein